MNREASSVDRLTNDAPPSSRLQKEERLSTRKANGSSSSTLHSLVQKVQTVSSHGDVHDRIPKTSSGLQFVRTDRVEQRKLREVDFYRNPTVLSRMILFQKYSSAIQVSVWLPHHLLSLFGSALFVYCCVVVFFCLSHLCNVYITETRQTPRRSTDLGMSETKVNERR